jgi:hypothetical protein
LTAWSAGTVEVVVDAAVVDAAVVGVLAAGVEGATIVDVDVEVLADDAVLATTVLVAGVEGTLLFEHAAAITRRAANRARFVLITPPPPLPKSVANLESKPPNPIEF